MLALPPGSDPTVRAGEPSQLERVKIKIFLEKDGTCVLGGGASRYVPAEILMNTANPAGAGRKAALKRPSRTRTRARDQSAVKLRRRLVGS